MIVDRTDAGMRTRQPEKLLERLLESYAPPKVSRVVTLKIRKRPDVAQGKPMAAGGLSMVASLPFDRLRLQRNLTALTGMSSVENYAVMGRQEWPVIYTPNIDKLVALSRPPGL